MKRMFLFATALAMLVVCPAFAQDKTKSEPLFETKEVYLQVDIQKPLLVTTEPVPKQYAHLGDSVRIWFAAQLRSGATSPCTSRDEKECHLEFRIAPKDADRSKLEYVDMPVRIDPEDGITFSTAYPITRDSALGEKVFILRVRYEDKILYTFEFPLEVRM